MSLYLHVSIFVVHFIRKSFRLPRILFSDINLFHGVFISMSIFKKNHCLDESANDKDNDDNFTALKYRMFIAFYCVEYFNSRLLLFFSSYFFFLCVRRSTGFRFGQHSNGNMKMESEKKIQPKTNEKYKISTVVMEVVDFKRFIEQRKPASIHSHQRNTKHQIIVLTIPIL